HLDSVDSVALGLWIGRGTRDETADVCGVAHLVEHMVFKGTERRTARDIAEQIEAVGGSLDAYTSREHTSFQARILRDDVDLALDLIGDMVCHSRLTEADLMVERTVVLQEIAQVADTPDDIIGDHFHQAAFAGQSFGWPILGSSASVSALDRSAVAGFVAQHYGADVSVVAASGRIDHEAFRRSVERTIGAMPSARPSPSTRAHYTGGNFRQDDALEQVQLAIGFPGLAARDPDRVALGLYAALLGGGMSSRLFQEIREELGLVYAISSHHSAYSDCGMLSIHAGTDAADLPRLIPALADSVRRSLDDLGDAEVERARVQARAGLLMSLEGPGGRADRLAGHVLTFGHVLSKDDMLGRLAAVTRDDILRVARRTVAQPMTFAALGRIGGLEPYDQIRERMGAASCFA
ncbi:MAG: pitrilysin family protein, partial [Alphaproteobacteria bacterium]